MNTRKIAFIFLLIFSIAVGQTQLVDDVHFIQNFRKYFHSDIQKAPFNLLSQSYISSDLYVTFKSQFLDEDLILSNINSSDFFEITALHQQTQLAFFGFSALKKEQRILSKKVEVLLILTISEYKNEEDESRFLIECAKIHKKLEYYSITSGRDFKPDEIRKAEILCTHL